MGRGEREQSAESTHLLSSTSTCHVMRNGSAVMVHNLHFCHRANVGLFSLLPKCSVAKTSNACTRRMVLACLYFHHHRNHMAEKQSHKELYNRKKHRKTGQDDYSIMCFHTFFLFLRQVRVGGAEWNTGIPHCKWYKFCSLVLPPFAKYSSYVFMQVCPPVDPWTLACFHLARIHVCTK